MENNNSFIIKNDNPLELCCTKRFRRDTKAGLDTLNKIYLSSMSKFVMLFANSEIMVYKICNYLADNFGLEKWVVKTLDGMVFESYFDISAKHQYNMIKLEYLLNEGPLRDIAGKWLIIPNMSSQWTSKLVHLVYSEIKNKGCLGLIFHSEGADNFGQILAQQTNMKVYEFPKRIYNQVKTLEDDGF